MRLVRLEDKRFLMNLSRIKHSRDFEGLEHLLKESERQLCQNLKNKTGEDFLRDQGAAQVIDDLLEYFEKAEQYVK